MPSLLLPGAHVLRRSRDSFQLGLHPDHAALLGDHPPDPVDLTEHPLRPHLQRAGLLADESLLRRGLGASRGEGWEGATRSAVARRAGSRLVDVLAAREQAVLSTLWFGHPSGKLVAEELVTTARKAGLRATCGQAPAQAPARAPAQAPLQPDVTATLCVLVGVGEPQRTLLDTLLQHGIPHLLVRLVEGSAVVGPLTRPGQTACLRCLDAYRTEQDPAWPLLVEQYARACARGRADGIAEPVDPAIAGIAVGWAVREIGAFLEDEEPPARAQTVEIAPGRAAPRLQDWPPHPHCGCTWE